MEGSKERECGGKSGGMGTGSLKSLGCTEVVGCTGNLSSSPLPSPSWIVRVRDPKDRKGLTNTVPHPVTSNSRIVTELGPTLRPSRRAKLRGVGVGTLVPLIPI